PRWKTSGFAARRDSRQPRCSRGFGNARPALAPIRDEPPGLILFPDDSMGNIVSPDTSVEKGARRKRRPDVPGNANPVTRVTWGGRRKFAYGGIARTCLSAHVGPMTRRR